MIAVLLQILTACAALYSARHVSLVMDIRSLPKANHAARTNASAANISTVRIDVVDVDIVVLWVDGHDPEWQERFRARAAAERMFFRRRFVRDKYFDGGELVYCLRAVEMYMPWYRVMHVITDGQWPGWMRRDHPRVIWHNHSDLLGPGRSSFSSEALQLNLLNITNLTERFILFDDDQFVLKPLSPESWFTETGIPRIRAVNESWVHTRERAAYWRRKCNATNSFQVYTAGVCRSWELVWERFNETRALGNAHVPMPLTRSLLADMNATYDLMPAAGLSFRSCTAPQFQHLVIFHGAATRLVEVSCSGYEQLWDKKSCRRFASAGGRTEAELLCANGCDAAWVSGFLPRLFDRPSSFEIPDYVWPPSPTPMGLLHRAFW